MGKDKNNKKTPIGHYTSAIKSLNLFKDGYTYSINGKQMTRDEAVNYILTHKNEHYVVNRYSTTQSTKQREDKELNWQTLGVDGKWIDNNEYHPNEGILEEVIVTHPYTVKNSLSQDKTYLQHAPLRDLTVTEPIDFTNTDQNMFHRRDVANADAAVREALSSDVVDHVYDYMMPSTWAGAVDKLFDHDENGNLKYNFFTDFNKVFNPTYDNQGWVGLVGADEWADEHPDATGYINTGIDLLLPFGVKGVKTATLKLPEASRNAVASTAINYGAKTRSLPTNIYKQRMLFNVGENGRRRYIHEYNPLADFIDTKRRIPSYTSYFFRSPNNVDILNVHNGSYGAKAQGNVIIGSGSVDGKFVSYGEPWMEFGVNPKLDAWYEFPTMKHRGPHRMATDWRGNRMDYTTQEAYDQMAIRRNPEFQKDYNEFIFKDFNSREEALQAQKDFNEKWGIDPSVNVYDIYHSNQTVIPNKEWNFNSEYPRGFLSQPFWRYTADQYSGAVQKELMMNWESPMKSLDKTHADIIPFIDPETGRWDYLTDFAQKMPTLTDKGVKISPEDLYNAMNKVYELKGIYVVGHGTSGAAIPNETFFNEGIRIRNAELSNNTTYLTPEYLTKWPHNHSENIVLLGYNPQKQYYIGGIRFFPDAFPEGTFVRRDLSNWKPKSVFDVLPPEWEINPSAILKGEPHDFVNTSHDKVIGVYNTETLTLYLNPQSLFDFNEFFPKQ